MIRHVVIWKLKNPADAPRFKALPDSCRALAVGTPEFEVGVCARGFEANADVVLVSTFTNAEALAAYQTHPHHQAAKLQLGPLSESRRVLDYHIAQAQHDAAAVAPAT
jgi:quinol monooxygenase YgiN